jgi:hypothetical protein
MWPDATDIVGFATESGQSKTRSEDAMYFDARMLTQEMEDEARELQRKYRILVRADKVEFHEKEYPVGLDPRSIQKVFRGRLTVRPGA